MAHCAIFIFHSHQHRTVLTQSSVVVVGGWLPASIHKSWAANPTPNSPCKTITLVPPGGQPELWLFPQKGAHRVALATSEKCRQRRNRGTPKLESRSPLPPHPRGGGSKRSMPCFCLGIVFTLPSLALVRSSSSNESAPREGVSMMDKEMFALQKASPQPKYFPIDCIIGLMLRHRYSVSKKLFASFTLGPIPCTPTPTSHVQP